MSLPASLYNRVLGHPFVYNHVRPFVVGGIDNSPLFDALGAQGDDVVMDVGCGTGAALTYLPRTQRYVGYDIDPVAVEFARKTYARREDASFEVKTVDGDEVARLAPSRVVLAGLLHHLNDDEARALLSSFHRSPRLQRIASIDIVYLRGKWFSNLLAAFDRGRHCRRQPEYEALVRGSGYRLTESRIVRSHPSNGRALYLVMAFEPNGTAAAS